jgi:hypothetical protein
VRRPGRGHVGGLALLLAAGCGGAVAPGPAPPAASGTAATGAPIRFRAQPLPFTYERGDSGRALPVETTGGGVGLLDFDGDGDLDLFFAQGASLKGAVPPTAGPSDVLLRNDGGGKFTDVSAASGLTFRGYGQGVTVADVEGDGDPDVFVTRYGVNTLWKNEGGRFVDATESAGLAGAPSWSLGAAFADLDADGDLDLFVADYFAFDPARAPFQRNAETGAAEYGPPAEFPGLPDRLYRNDGSRFVDVTAAAGVAASGRGMGVLAADLDGDRRPDILVANDAEPNALWRNAGDGTFTDEATVLGIAVNGAGQPEANMGIARGDADGDGVPDVLITHFYDEHDTLWRGERGPDGGRFYRDATFEAGLGTDSRPLTGWGTALADFDGDGRLDLIVAAGHIRPESNQKYRYENPPILWRGEPGGRFANVTAGAGEYFRSRHLARGLACGDLDGDLDLDVAIVHHHGPSVVLWNETPAAGRAVVLDLRGAGGNRDAIGAEVTVEAGGRTFSRAIDGGGSYLSSGDRRVHVGIGSAAAADRVTVRWPSGREESRAGLAAGRVHAWEEGAGGR